MLLHRALQFETGLVDIAATGLRLQTMQARHRPLGKALWQIPERHRTRLDIVDDRIARGLAEHQQIEQ
ncbi:MAG: hypothetical protein AW12_02938 [Candidatus Accumulibacter sp. BA-94]|nr:MAG: hypothetical protein AW12_02938 [Candidatus Accumulibacter sp. BA-94]